VPGSILGRGRGPRHLGDTGIATATLTPVDTAQPSGAVVDLRVLRLPFATDRLTMCDGDHARGHRHPGRMVWDMRNERGSGSGLAIGIGGRQMLAGRSLAREGGVEGDDSHIKHFDGDGASGGWPPVMIRLITRIYDDQTEYCDRPALAQ
jgi:hypothetical protein